MTVPAKLEPKDELHYRVLGEAAEGEIEGVPEKHARIDELTKRVAGGEFHVPTTMRIPCGCIDGRCGGWVRPDAAGGALSLAVADDLLLQQFAGDGSTAAMVRNVFQSLIRRGFPVGDHTDDRASEDESGCGANDKLKEIYDLMARKSDTLRALARGLGVDVKDDDHSAIIAGAQRRTEFSTGREALEAMQAESPPENIDKLEGEHHEVVAVINFRENTTLDRDAIKAEFGEEYQAFNIDVWSFENAATALYPEADEATIKRTVIAMVYYNLATALKLCGPNMRVIVLN